jgi:hypothetical protein
MRTLVCIVLIIVWTRPGMAQTQESVAAENQSAAEASKQAANPLANTWLMQFQQNNNWIGTPTGIGDRIQGNLQFQPLMSVKLTDDWTLVSRPVLQMFSSAPYQKPTGRVRRVTGFGDTALAFALSPGPALVGNWLLAADPTFILPTATESLLGK